MKRLLRLFIAFSAAISLNAQDTLKIGPGTIEFLIRNYSLYSNSVVICANPIVDAHFDFPFAAERGKEADAIASYLSDTFGIYLSQVDDGITVASLKHVNGAPGRATIPRVIVGGNLRFIYSLEGSKDIHRTITAEMAEQGAAANP